MDKAWTTPPTVLPRADVGPTTDSAVNDTAPGSVFGVAAGSDCVVA